MRIHAVLAAAAMLSGCKMAISQELSNGCYYYDDIPVLTVDHHKATFLVASDFPEANVERRRKSGLNIAKFTPGFVISGTKVVKAVTFKEAPSIYIMMVPATLQPTLGVPKTDGGVAALTLGEPCKSNSG